MLIIGTGGLAKDIAGNVSRHSDQEQYVFYNDTKAAPDKFLNRYRVINSLSEASEYLQSVDSRFTVAVANPLMRMRLNERFKREGGVPHSLIFAEPQSVSAFMQMGSGCIIQYNTIVSSNTFIGEGVFINCGSVIGHDVVIQNYCSFGPGVRILGDVEIGEYSYIGTGSIIMPGVKIGKKVRVGVGEVVTANIPDNTKWL